MSRARATLLTAFLCSAVWQTGHAQCSMEMTEPQCFEAVERELAESGMEIIADAEAVEKKKAATLSNTEDALRLFNAGTSAALSEGGVSTLEDFLPRFKIFGSGGGLGEDDETLVIEFNQFLGLPVDDGYKFAATLQRPAPFKPLVDSVAEDMRAGVTDELQSQLNDFDDVTFTFTYSPMTHKLGRSDHQLHSDIFNELYLGAESLAGDPLTAAETARENSDDALDELLGPADGSVISDWRQDGDNWCASQFASDDDVALLEGFEFDLLTGNQLLCAALSASDADRASAAAAQSAEALHDVNPETTGAVQDYIAGAARAYREEYVSLANLNASLDAVGFFDLASLINNQPQLNVSASVSRRDPLAGQDETSVRISYEKGFVNVNSFRRFAEQSCGSDLVYRCLQEYLTPANLRHLERGDRLAFNLEYSRKQAYNRTLASGAGGLMLAAEKSFTASLGYGRYLTFLEDGAGNSRLELSASYEDIDSDSMRQDRLFSTLTYSQRISDTAAVSFSVVYANKPEFRGDVGHEVSAQLGLNYKLFAPKEF